MKLWLSILLLFALVTTVLSWEKEDHEIFDLVSELEAAEGKGTSFYSWLDVADTASTAEIAKAYRKKSMKIHPDKNPGVKNIHKKFARLGVIAKLLRNKESRKRYDFFYRNGVPKWRGTGYYYSRYRPGLGTVTVFLMVLSSLLQYVVQGIKYKQDVDRIEKIVGDARAAAWGNRTVPLEGRRKVRVNLGGPRYLDEDGNVVAGKMLDMVVEGTNVYILDPSGDLEQLDASAATQPSLRNTWVINLVKRLVRRIQEGGAGKQGGESDSGSGELSEPGTESEGSTGASSGRNTPVGNRSGRRRRRGRM